MSLANYKTEREKFYSSLREDFWPELYDTEYALYGYYSISKKEIEEIKLATERLGLIYKKTAYLLRNAEDNVLTDLDLPINAINFARLKTLASESIIARFDFVKTSNGIKMLEVNSDTPTFIKELFHINNLMCKNLDVKDPNEGAELQLAIAVRKAVKDSLRNLKYFDNESEQPNVVFTAHENNIEDEYTSKYLQNISGVDSKFVALEKLQIDKDGLYDDEGNKIHVLYRQTWPIEYLVFDQDEDGSSIGKLLLKLVEEGKLAVINPPSAFLLQSKAVQSAIWFLAEKKIYFTDQEQKWIKKYMLPTYLEKDELEKKGLKYVKKPSFGREGDTIEIIDSGNVVLADEERSYEQSKPVYQQYVELPKEKVKTLKGEEKLHILIGSFLVDGEPSAIGLRASNSVITGNMSYFLPIGIEKENKEEK